MAIDLFRFVSVVAVFAVLPLASCKRGADPESQAASSESAPVATETAPAAEPAENPAPAAAPDATAKAPVSEDEFFQAAHDGDIEKVRTALDRGIKVGLVNQEGRTALMLTAFNGHTGIVRLLVESGADVNVRDELDRTALMYAATGPYVETVSYLLDRGAKVNIVDNNEHWTPLMFAAGEGQTGVVQMLLDAGADPTAIDIDGEDALLFAAAKGTPKPPRSSRRPRLKRERKTSRSSSHSILCVSARFPPSVPRLKPSGGSFRLPTTS